MKSSRAVVEFRRRVVATTTTPRTPLYDGSRFDLRARSHKSCPAGSSHRGLGSCPRPISARRRASAGILRLHREYSRRVRQCAAGATASLRRPQKCLLWRRFGRSEPALRREPRAPPGAGIGVRFLRVRGDAWGGFYDRIPIGQDSTEMNRRSAGRGSKRADRRRSDSPRARVDESDGEFRP